MLYAMIDIHKHVFQAAVLEPESGELVEERFAASRDALGEWAMRWQGKLVAVAIEATTGWRWVARELQASGFDVRLVDPGELRARRGKKRPAKTDRLDARFGALLLAKEMLPESWLPPAGIQELRDRTRLRKALAQDRTRWAQRLHALLTQEGWPCQRARLLTGQGRARSSASSLASPAAIGAAWRCRRSLASGRSSPATCSPRSATHGASAAPARSFASQVSTRASPTPPTAAPAAGWPRRAHRPCAGRLSKPRSTAAASAAPTGVSTRSCSVAAAASARS
jgi:hypothetical protein